MDLVNLNTLRDIMLNSEQMYSERTAIEFLKGSQIQKVNFSDFIVNIKKVACNLNRLGFENSRIALVGRMSYEWLVIFYGILYSGNIVVPLDFNSTAEDFNKKIDHSKAALIVYDKKLNKKLLLYINSTERKIAIPDLFEEAMQENSQKICIETKINPNAPALIIFTSGTTGKSKAVILTHNNICSDIKGSFELCEGKINEKEIERTMTVLPPHHAYEITIGLLYQLTYGGVVCISKNIKYFSRDLLFFKPTAIVVVPLVLETLYNRIMVEIEKEGKEKLISIARKACKIGSVFGIDIRRKVFFEILEKLGGNLRLIHCGGANLDLKYLRFFQDIGLDIFVGYGMTECSPAIAANKPSERRDGSVGKVMPLPYAEVKIKDGEILVRGEIVFNQYLAAPELTEAAFKDGWFMTGDLGYFDKDGFLYLTGRKKNLIILSNGENVSPEEIEDLLKKVEHVDEVMVSEKRLENGIVIIGASIFVRKELDSCETRKKIKNDIAKCNRNLSIHQKIKHIEFVDDEFPKNHLGKIIRR